MAASGIAVTAAAPASAASACTKGANNRWWCYNTYGAEVVGYDSNYMPTPSAHEGNMYSTHSWFLCRIDSGPYVGGPHPHRWLWTQGDTSTKHDGWGWVRDTAISSETNSLPDCGLGS
ncbi:hypothetical protein [Mangrovactinospora gilvigrisea]|uniref:hypothetical protein n=1 Tax=Mangrovactinospora gilvigrisea TaxID=1428644 RepID=UPI0009A0EF4A|nr:hypothetical protein [Mangrovactinospora gilvigrisea]